MTRLSYGTPTGDHPRIDEGATRTGKHHAGCEVGAMFAIN